MPTPIRYFVKIARDWGNVDPDDYDAIENWYLNELPKFPKKKIKAILDELLQYSNEEEIMPDNIVYPSDIPLPLMKDIIPASGMTWKATFSMFLKYIQILMKPVNKK